MKLPRVLVTEREFQRATSVFTEAAGLTCMPVPGEEAALAAAVTAEGARFVIVGALPYRDRLYAAVPSGGVIARFGVGYDNIDRTKAATAGIVCTNTPGVLDQSVAELTVLFIVAAARHLLGIAGQMRQQVWEQTQGIELSGRTLAIIGCGRIGGAVARIASAGFGMRVVGYRRPGSTGAVPEQVAYAKIVDDFASAVSGADFVSVHVPATPENAGFIDDTRLAQLPAQAWLINTARGIVVEERALYAALATGRIAGAALDVFQQEPYMPIDPACDLRILPNVILTPHVGSHTVEANRRMAERALDNIRLALAGDWAQMDRIN